MSKRKKANKLSDGRYPWEPKPETLERRSNQAFQTAKTRAEYLSETPNSYKITDLCQELYRLSGRGMFINEVGKPPGWILLEDLLNPTHVFMVSEYNPEKQFCSCEPVGGILLAGQQSIEDFQHCKIQSYAKSLEVFAKLILGNYSRRIDQFNQDTLNLKGL